MSDIVERLRAPAYWFSGSSEGHEGENNAPYEAAARIERLEADQRDTTEEFGKLSHDLGKALLEAKRLREANELMLTDIRRTDVDMMAFKARIERLEAALRPLACTCTSKHPDGCSSGEVDCPFWNARVALAALDYRQMDVHSIGHKGGSCPRERT